MIKLHEGDSDDDDFRHVCIITVFLLIKLFYLLIHFLNYLFRLVQIFVILTNFINLVVISSLIACCLLNSFLKLTLSH